MSILRERARIVPVRTCAGPALAQRMVCFGPDVFHVEQARMGMARTGQAINLRDHGPICCDLGTYRDTYPVEACEGITEYERCLTLPTQGRVKGVGTVLVST